MTILVTDVADEAQTNDPEGVYEQVIRIFAEKSVILGNSYINLKW